MAISLNKYRAKPLTIELGGKEYVSRPPDTETMTLIAALIASGEWAALGGSACPTCNRPTEEFPAEWVEVIEKNKARDLAEILFGRAERGKMRRAKLPEADINMAAMYAMWHWLYGEETARQMIEAQHGLGVEAEDAPKD